MPTRAFRRPRQPRIDLFGVRRPVTAKRTDPLEEAEQRALFDWRNRMTGKFPELRWLHSSLNGVPLSQGLAVKMRSLGMTAGVCDVFLPVKRGAFSGLYIEMKRLKGVPSDLSDDQEEFIQFTNEQGYYATWCKGWEAAKQVITDYLEGRVCRD